MQNKAMIRGLALLGGCEFLFTATLSIGNTLAGVVGATLTTNPNLATAPYAAMTLVTAIATVFASFLMRRVGRRLGFLIGGVACLMGGSVAVLAIWDGSFTVFCLGYGLIGVFKAFAQYYRFAAAELPSDFNPVIYLLLNGKAWPKRRWGNCNASSSIFGAFFGINADRLRRTQAGWAGR
jgi:MFS family permease